MRLRPFLPVLALQLAATALAAQRPSPPSAEQSAKGKKAARADTVTIWLDPTRDQVFREAVVDERPEVLSVPALAYPDLLRQAGVQGRVLVQAIVDTMGRAEPGSVKIIDSPNPGFNEPARYFVLGAKFRPARVHGRAVRVLVNLPIDFKFRRPEPERAPPPS